MIKIKLCKTHGVEYTKRCKACQTARETAYRATNGEKIRASKRAAYAKKAHAAVEATQPVWLTVHKIEDSKRHSSVARKSLPARGMASSEY